MEILDLYDINNHLTGETIVRGIRNFKKGFFVKVAVVWMENKNGNFLIQKASKLKDGKWATTGGHVQTGQNSIQTIVREVNEELGVKFDQNLFNYIKTVKLKSALFDIYYMKVNLNPKKLVLQKEEVAEVKYASLDDIMKMIKDGSFRKTHSRTFKEMLNFRENLIKEVNK